MTSKTENIAYRIPAGFIQVVAAEIVSTPKYPGKSPSTCRKNEA